MVRLIDLLRAVVDEVKEGGDPRLPLELALVKVCRPPDELALEALDQRLSQLESTARRRAAEPAAGRRAGPAGRSRRAGPAARARPAPSAEPAEPAAAEPRRRPRRAATAVAEPATLEQVERSAGGGDRCPRSGAARRRCTRWCSPPARSPDDGGIVVLGLPASKAFAKSIVETPAEPAD